jgi:elongation factor Ts
MVAITADLVKQLRDRTDAGMMECKKFLVASNGDIEAAIVEMRKAHVAKSDKKADRTASEGMVVIAADKHSGVVVEINCETDFAARQDLFIDFANKVAALALSHSSLTEVDELGKQTLTGGDTIEKTRQELVAKIGENIKLRRMSRLHAPEGGCVGSYLHGSRIAVLIALSGGSEALAKDLAMHIAASKPVVVSREQVSPQLLDRERDILTAQAKESGKPQEIIDKMIEGRLVKFVEEISLLDQAYVKNPEIKVAQLLREHQASVHAFIRYEVGEGIEKSKDNFVEEVMAQVRSKDE